MPKILDKIYSHLPVHLQHAAVSAYGFYWHWLRFGPGYEHFVEEYKARERWDADSWKKYQAAKLKEVLSAASTDIPYYRRTWSEGQKKSAGRGDLHEMPLLEKDPLRVNPHDFVNDRVRIFPKFTYNTSGSTGTPIATIWSIPEIRETLAFREARSVNWAGTSFKEPRGTFSGRMVEPDPDSTGPFYRYNIFEQQVYFSPFHLKPDTAKNYVEAINRYNLKWLTGYAVSYYLLAKLINLQNLKVRGLKAVITTSEKLSPAMRKEMQTAYGCPIFEEYSTVESAVFASECEHGKLHASPDVSCIEILDSKGNPCGPGVIGEVVATTLFKRTQPLIRFRLGDTAMWDPEPCPCGRSMPVIKEVIGRIEDVVIGPDGRRLVRFHGIWVGLPNVIQGQIIQEKIDLIKIRVLSTEKYNKNDEETMISRIKQRLGDGMNVIVERVTSMPLTKSGKFQAVVSMLKEKGVKEAETTGLGGSK